MTPEFYALPRKAFHTTVKACPIFSSNTLKVRFLYI